MPSVLQFCHMSNTLTVRLPEELLNRLREKARRTGLPMSRMVRQSLEASLNGGGNQAWRKFAGIIKGGPRDVSSRKGFSRG
jgi:predicted transcriptional regulator